MDSNFICFFCFFATCALTHGFIFSGFNAILESTKMLKSPGWHFIAGWNAKKSISKPGLFIKDVSMNKNKSTVTISQPGIYYLSYNLRIQTKNGGKFNAAAVIDNNLQDGLSIIAQQHSKTPQIDISGGGFIKLTEFNNISVTLEINSFDNTDVSLQSGSSFSLSLITTAGVIPSFSFTMQNDHQVKPQIPNKITNWSDNKIGQFHSSVGFVPGRSFIQAICDGIYLVSVNLIAQTTHATSLRVQMKVGDVIVREINETFSNQTIKTINMHQIMHLNKADVVSLELVTNDAQIEIKRHSSWSASLVNKITKHTSGFRSIIRNKFIVNKTNSYFAIYGWPNKFDKKTEFKSPTVFTSLVNKNQDFNPPHRGIFLLTASINMQCASLISKQVTISVYSQAFSFAVATKTITGIDSLICNRTASIAVSLSTALDLLKTESISISIKTNTSGVVILPGSSFAICEIMVFYPGMLGRLTAQERYKTGWHVLRNWKTNQIRGGYDFLSNFNVTTGQYKIPINGLYLISTNIVLNDLSEVEGLISVGGKINIANGLYTKVGNPTSVMTINIAGLVELKRHDEISAMIHSPSDGDWSVKENSGFSVAYIGQSSHCFRAYLSESTEVTSTGWTAPKKWQTLLVYGSAFTAGSGQFKVPVSGVYYTAATLILFKADSIAESSYFQIAVRINGKQVDGLLAYRSGPKTLPIKRRYFPFFLSGSFKASHGDTVTLEVFSSYDVSYNILENSGWSMFLVAADGNAEQVGFGVPRSIIKNFFKTSGSEWYAVENWDVHSSATGAFYTSSKINFDDGIEAVIRSSGFYLISANIKLRYDSSSSVFKLALFIQDELQDNGLTYENTRAWTTFTMHFTGVAFLTEDETVKLKISSAAAFDGAIIHKESGFSIVKLQLAESFPGVSVIVKEPYNIPVASSFPVNAWSVQNRASSFSFTSGRRYNKTSGIFRVRDAGFYLVSMNLVLLSNSSNSTNITVTMQAGSSSEKYFLEIGNRSAETISSTTLITQEVSDQIFIATNISGESHSVTNQTNSSSWRASDILIQAGSSFSVVKFPFLSSSKISYAIYKQSVFYSSPGMQELSGWSIPPLSTKSDAKFISNNDGIFFISMNVKLSHFIGTASFYFASNTGELATSVLTCQKHCQEYITMNNFVRLKKGDTVSVYMMLGPNSHLTLAATSHRTIAYIRDYETSVGVSVRTNTSQTFSKTGVVWKTFESGYMVHNGSHGTFDARGNYSTIASMIIPTTGAYQVVVNFIASFSSNTDRQGTVEIEVSKNGVLSKSSALYTKREFVAGQNFTLHIISSVIIQKWTKISLMIRSDQNIVIQRGSTISIVFIDSIINEICKDEGPRMGDPLSPAFLSTAIVGVKKEWTCSAFGNKNPTYRWFKNEQMYKNIRVLNIEGKMNDSGVYYCEANINGITAQSNQLDIRIYDVDECYYGNHTCHAQAMCSNNQGSFDCTCKAGFTGNGTLCTDIDECKLGLHDCVQYAKCNNLEGTFSCFCPAGFFGDGKVKCTDLNECLSPTWNDCNSNANCTNIPGSYRCTCNNGWSGDGKNCTDLDECRSGTHNCDQNAVCFNSNGTYSCTCNKGYFGNGYKGNCTDVNECLYLPKTTPNPLITKHPNATKGPYILYCHADAFCVNYDGKYGCACKTGFTGNGTHCYDINECDTGVQNIKCARTADCFNTHGTYICKCRQGYNGDGVDCKDVDECTLQTHKCDKLANCTNLYGSYECSCPKGYLGDGKSCAITSNLAQSTDPCFNDKTSLKCICKDSKQRDENILCNGLFVAIIILSVVAIIVIMFGVKYIKSRKNIKIGPVKMAKDKYIEMEDESEV